MTESAPLRPWALAAGVAMAAALAMIFLYAPADELQGDVQRIFYLHVPAAVAAFACFAVVVGAGAVQLWRGSLRADRLAEASAEVGLLLTTVVLVMGSLWAKPIWGTYWTWDARLTSTLVLWLIYAGYFAVRRLSTSRRQAARLSAVVGILGFIDVPVVYFSVTWWRTLHPQPVISSGALAPAMMTALRVTVVAVALLAAVLVTARYRLRTIRDETEDLRESSAAGRPAADQPRQALGVDAR